MASKQCHLESGSLISKLEMGTKKREKNLNPAELKL